MIGRRALVAGSILGGISTARAASEVDLLLVMAVDVSRSIDAEEAQMQRQGYRDAMSDPRVLAAIRSGPTGAIAVAYVEWAGFQYQQLIIPWTRIGSEIEARAWSATLERSPRQSMSWTSISGALSFSRGVLADSPFEAARRVIDVSGDGRNNNGPPAEQERDRLISEDVTINGLPIVNERPNFGYVERGLEEYYRNSVIGGVGAFLIVADDFAAFGAAIRRKLIREIASAPASSFG